MQLDQKSVVKMVVEKVVKWVSMKVVVMDLTKENKLDLLWVEYSADWLVEYLETQVDDSKVVKLDMCLVYSMVVLLVDNSVE